MGHLVTLESTTNFIGEIYGYFTNADWLRDA